MKDDLNRIKQVLDEFNVSIEDVTAFVLGGHGDTMVPLPRYTTVGGIPVTEFLDDATIDRIVQRTKKGGGEIVNLLGTSGWYAPGASAAQMVEAILKDSKRIFPVCTHLTGQYGVDDLFLGAPVKLGRNGIEEVIELKLNDEELALMHGSATAVREVVDTLKAMGI